MSFLPPIAALQAFADESFGIYHDEIQDVVLRIAKARAEDALRQAALPRADDDMVLYLIGTLDALARPRAAKRPCLGAKRKAARKMAVCSTTMMPPVAPSRK